MENQLV